MGTAGLVWLSRKSLFLPKTHGFYRFFAWDINLALLLINVERWFVAPFSIHQIVSWLLLIISLFLMITSIVQLHRGKPDSQRKEDALFGLEKTTALVTSGLYKYIRHPMYSSLLFLAWGIFFKRPDWLNGILAIITTGFLIATARVEEKEDILFFGPVYEEYMEKTGMFLPRVW
jgi:protein-S-isoprenylcysteine O-methyltransferase Ste14